jgi:ubiquinone/menaquinone biosynthesis C-methylase UbiE
MRDQHQHHHHQHQQVNLPRGEQQPTPTAVPATATRQQRQQQQRQQQRQRQVTQRFAVHARAWQDFYQASDLSSRIYQRRHARTLGLIDQLDLPAGSAALEVGPGAGYTTVALARRGLKVTAIDATPALLELTRRQVEAADLPTPGPGQVGLLLGDTHQLPVADARFEVAVALGVLPWLHTPAQAVAELARVLRPGGHLVVSADNHARLTHWLDPLWNPALRPVRQAVKALLGATGRWRPRDHGVPATYHRLGEVDRLLTRAGLERRAGVTLGFGPLTLAGRPVLPKRIGQRVDRRLQQLADRGVPWLRSAGAHYLVIARTPQPPSNPAG